MMISRAILVFCIAGLCAASGAVAADTPKSETNGSVATSSVDTASPKHHASKRPKYHVNFQPASKKSTGAFQGITQSMPAAAVKEELVRKHEMPSAQTSVLTPGSAAGISTAPVAGRSEQPPAASGAAPNILSPGKVAEPESKTLEN